MPKDALREHLGIRYRFRNGKFRDSRNRLLRLTEGQFQALWEHERSLGTAMPRPVAPSEPDTWDERVAWIVEGQKAFEAGPEPFQTWIRDRIGREPTPEVMAAMQSVLRTCEVPTARWIGFKLPWSGVRIEFPPPVPNGRLHPLLSRAYWVADIENPRAFLRQMLQKRIKARASDRDRKAFGRSRKRATGTAVDELLEQAKVEDEDATTPLVALDAADERVDDDEALDLIPLLAAKGLTHSECDVMARRVEGQSYRQIAAATNRHWKTVDSLIQRARRKIREN